MVNFGPESSSMQAFYLVGAMFIILTGAIVGFFILEPIITTPDANWHDIYNNGLVWNLTLESTPDCYFGERNCTDSCINNDIEDAMGCCDGCRNPASCNVHVTLKWVNVPPRKKQQRIWLLASADCKNWWQTGWAPFLVTWNTAQATAADELLHPKNKTETDDDTAVSPAPAKTSPAAAKASPAAAKDARSLGAYDDFYGGASDDYLAYSEANARLTERLVADPLYFATMNDTLPGHSSGKATVTNGCFGDPYRQLALVGCLSDMDPKFLKGKTWDDGVPWARCISVYGACINLDYVFTKDLPCCIGSTWIPKKQKVPKDSPYPGARVQKVFDDGDD